MYLVLTSESNYSSRISSVDEMIPHDLQMGKTETIYPSNNVGDESRLFVQAAAKYRKILPLSISLYSDRKLRLLGRDGIFLSRYEIAV